MFLFQYLRVNQNLAEMKKFIWIPITIISLSSCRYPSFYEAKYSCNEWKKKGELYSGIIKALEENNQRGQDNTYLYKDTINNFSTRKCEKDSFTNQILGFNAVNRKGGEIYIFRESQRSKDSLSKLIDFNIDWKVEKRFRY